MIVYGTKVVHLTTVELPSTECPSCQTKGTSTLSIFRKHFHLFWIPTFPVGKVGECQCHHCNHVLLDNELPRELRQYYENLKHKTKGPLWQFSGLTLIAILITWGIISSKQNTALELEYLETPQIGDVYETKTESGNYSTFRAFDIVADTVFIVFNQYEINKMTKLYQIDIEENYESDSLFLITKAELKEMYEENDIIGINREE